MPPDDELTDGPADTTLPPGLSEETKKSFLEKLFLDHYESIVRQLMVKYPQLAWDAAHEAYLRLRETKIGWEAVRSPKAYLYRIVRREAKRLAHGTAWTRRVLTDPDLMTTRMNQASAEPGDNTSAAPGSDAEAAFHRLTELQKQVYAIHTEEGLPARLIAHRLDIPQDRAERALTAARRTMKEALSHTPQGRPRK